MTIENVETVETVDPIAAYTKLIDAMRTPDVTGNNSATAWARETFTRLAVRNEDGKQIFTADTMIGAVCNVYKPCTAKGVRKNTVGALRESGWQAMAKRLTDMQYIEKNMGVGNVAEIVAEFVASTKTNDSFAKLNSAVKAAVSAAGKAAAPSTEPDGETGGSEGETGGSEGASPPATNIVDLVKAMTAHLLALPDCDLLALASGDDLADLSIAVNAAYDRGAALIADMEGEALAA